MLYNTLRQYEYIVAIADAGSLTDAAAYLRVSQPSLSVAVTRVEQRLGRTVFVRRKGAPIEITPFGHRIIRKARDLLARADEIEMGPEANMPFVVGCFEDIAPWYLAPALIRLETQFPDLDVQVREGRFSGLEADLSEGRADIVISYDIGFGDGFTRQRIRTITPVAFMSTDHPFAGRISVELEELVADPMILFAEDLSEGFVRNLLDDMRLTPDIRQRVSSLEMMRSLAAHGVGVGISYSDPPGDISYDGAPLVTVPIATPQAAADIVLLWSNLREPDTTFSEILQQLLQL